MNQPKPIIILGNGGHSKVLIDILMLQNRTIIGFTAPTEEENEFGIPYLGNDEMVFEYDMREVELVNAMGSSSNTALRKKLFCFFKSKQYKFTQLVHPKAVIGRNVKLGEGVQVMAGAIIQASAKINDNTIVNTSSIIDHDCNIGQHCHIAPGTSLSGSVQVGNSTHIGIGSTVIQDVNVGSNVLIGAGAVVVNNVLSNRIVYGVPAKEVKQNE